MADLSKVMIYGCLALSAAGLGTHVWMTKRYEEAGKDSERSLRSLQAIASAKLDIEALETERGNDIWNQKTSKGQDRYHEYFADCAKNAKMGKYEPAVQPPKDSTPSGKVAFKDKTYELNWTFDRRNKGGVEGFSREQIAAFLWYLEEGSKLLRVSFLDLKGDPDFGDRWVPRVNVTERRPLTAAETGS